MNINCLSDSGSGQIIRPNGQEKQTLLMIDN